MKLSRLIVSNYRALRDLDIPLSSFGCLVGENNAGKSTVLQALSLFFSGSKLGPSNYFDPSLPIRIAIKFEDIQENDLMRLASEHRDRVRSILDDNTITLVRKYDLDGKSTLQYQGIAPKEIRFSKQHIDAIMKGEKPGSGFVSKMLSNYPELDGTIDASMNQGDMRASIDGIVQRLGPEHLVVRDCELPTGLDKSIYPMLPDPIYIPAVKDLSDDTKTTESTPFGRILSILLKIVEAKLPDTKQLFSDLNEKLNRQVIKDKIVDKRLDEIKDIEKTVQRYLQESFSGVGIRIEIPPPELKSILSSARIYANDGVDGLIESKGDGLRRAVVFSVFRSYVELKGRLSNPKEHELGSATDVGESTSLPGSYLLLFEEPELFLHPQAQQILFGALRDFSRDHHVVVTTHSPMFLGAKSTGSFVRMKKMKDFSVSEKPFSQARAIDLSEVDAKSQFQLICFENNNAAFFADTVVLVEGDSDFLVMPHLASTLNPSWNTTKCPTVFVRIGGKGNIRKYRDFFERFGVRVPVIADLDLIISGFEHVNPDEKLMEVKQDLMRAVDEQVESLAGEDAQNQAKKARSSGELRGLWRKVLDERAKLLKGESTVDDIHKAVEEFYAWERREDRLEVLQSSKDASIVKIKHRLLDMLRDVDVFVLERGAVEQYYPVDLTGPDKPTKAQNFCASISCSQDVYDCCGMQTVLRNEKYVEKPEFSLIFEKIFS